MTTKYGQNPPHGSESHQSKEGRHAPRILVVEDGIIMARDIERRLKTLGYSVAGIATSGEEAVRLSAQLRPDLILMDVNLRSPMDGIQAAEQIRSHTEIPVVYVTGYSDEATLQRARQTDPFGYVLKPFEERELRTTIEMALYRHALYLHLRESEQRYRAVSELTSDFAYALRVEKDGTPSTEWVTEAFARTTGLIPDVLPELSRHVHPDDAGIVKSRLAHLLAGKSAVTEYRVVTKEGAHLWFREHAQPLWDEGKSRVVRVMAAAQDITAQKHAEEHLLKGVRASEECDGDIRNHLRGMSSCVRLLLDAWGGAAKAREKGASAEDVLARMAEVLKMHELIYDGSPTRRVPLAKHLRVVVADMFRRHGVSRLTYSVEAPPMEADARTAVHVLLVLQEVVMNLLRHSFPEGRRGHLSVHLGAGTKGKLELKIADNGVGMGREFDYRKSKLPGLRFAAGLCKEIKGQLTYSHTGGTVSTLVFPGE